MIIADETQGELLQIDMRKQLGIFQGLYDLSLAMVAKHSLDENLTLIVEKSQRLLGTDTSFIALHDEKTDELCWHISSGLVTESFKNLRVPMGIGLAGKVAKSGKYLVVEDYYREIGPEMQEVTRGEGLISGIAVPIQIGQTNFGVLFAFNRTKTKFTKTDLYTLNLFGNLAAVEITRKQALTRIKEGEKQYRKLYETSRRDKELYQSFLNASIDAISIYDIKGRVLYVSPSFTNIFGWTKAELNNEEAQFIPEVEQNVSRDLFYRILEKGDTISDLETNRLAKDGSELDVRISASLYHDHRGNPAGVFVILRDVTSFKFLERARQRAVHILSHELLTPLSIIESNVKKLGKLNLSEADREKKTNRIQGNLNRLKDLQIIVQEIVDTPTYRPTPLRLTTFTRDTIKSLRTEFSHRDIKLTTRLESVGIIVFDQRILELILRTLIKNAVENTPDEGEIVVSLSRLENGVCLEVMDYGIGIPAKDRDFIFKAFHHTRHTDLYSTRKPYDFDAGGKGLELMRLKILSGEGAFDIDFTSDRCRYIPNRLGKCCGRISECDYIENEKDCRQSGKTTFSVLFHLAP